jgi:hypothetical protein
MIEEVPITLPRRLILAYRRIAAINQAEFAGWLEFCCTSKLPREQVRKCRFRSKRPAIRNKPPHSLDRIRAGGDKKSRYTLKLSSEQLAVWRHQAEACGMMLDQWIIWCCNHFLDDRIHEIVQDLVGPDRMDRGDRLAARLFYVYHQLEDKRSRNALLRELGVGRIAVARRAAELPEGLLDELEQLTDRMLAIVSRDHGVELDYLDVPRSTELRLNYNQVADVKLRFYFTARFRRLRFSRATRASSARMLVGTAVHQAVDVSPKCAKSDYGYSILLEPRRDRRPLSIEQRQQRLLAGQAIHGLYRLALQDATVDQLIESLDTGSPFGQYAASELRYSRGRSAFGALDSLSVAKFLDSLE